jgi:HSP20 family molecular chaperone IbpA
MSFFYDPFGLNERTFGTEIIPISATAWSPSVTTTAGGAAREWRPRTDYSEDESNYYFRMELAGLSKADANISMEGNVLVITGERNPVNEFPNEKYDFCRSTILCISTDQLE